MHWLSRGLAGVGGEGGGGGVSWCRRCLRYHRFGVWVVSRARWARVPGGEGDEQKGTEGTKGGGRPVLVFRKVESAITAAAVFQEEYPEERFEARAMGVEALDWGAQWSAQEIERKKAYWRAQRDLGSGISDRGAESQSLVTSAATEGLSR